MPKSVNTQGTDGGSVTVGLPRYELIDKDGKSVCESSSLETIRRVAAHLFPDQEQDEERSGRGWDVRVVGA